jgi:HK97 family phage major capsid protein
MDKLRELQQRFNALVKELRASQAEENPDAAKVASIETELRSLAGQIETERLIIRTQDGIDPEAPHKEGVKPGDGIPSGEEEQRAAVLAYMRTGEVGQELRAMSTGKTSGGDTGGYLIPESWENRILEKAREEFVMRQISTVETSATDKNIPIGNDLGQSVWLAEAAAYTDSDLSFSGIIMNAHKVGRAIKVSEELMEDNQYDLEGHIINAFGYSNGLAEEQAYISGDGTGKPRGFTLDAQVALTSAAGTAITYEELLNLFKSLKSGYDAGARWIMNKNTMVEFMKLKDAAGQYIFRPFVDPSGIGRHEVGYLMGRPVTISSFMPDIAFSAKAVAYGNFSYYRIQDRSGFTIQRLNEAFAMNGQVGFRGHHRTDGKLLLPEAIKVIQQEDED